MSFIVGAVIGAGASIIGGSIASKGAKKAAGTAAAASDREIEFNRESRDLARGDQAPYREAGVTALDALMSMTGLGGGPKKSQPVNTNRAMLNTNRAMFGPEGPDVRRHGDVMAGDKGFNYRSSAYSRYAGGPMAPNDIYNVSELGPENIYSGGNITRPRNPVTIDGQTGYVEPNIRGRVVGGFMPGAEVMGDMYGRRQNYPINKNPNDTSEGSYSQTGAQPPPGPQPGPNPGTANGGVMENPGGQEGGYNFMTDPGYNFRFNEGMRALERGAAARGGLLSGGLGRKAIRYGQDYASNEYTNVYNRIANIAGLGQTSATTSGNAAMYAGANMGTAAAQGGYAQAAGQQGSANAWANAGNQIAQLPWGEMNWGNKNIGGTGGSKY